MTILQKISLRLALLFLIIIGCHFAYLEFHYEKDLAKDELKLKFDQVVQNSDVLYFSASPNIAHHPEDADKRTISQMMDGLTDLKVNSVDIGAIHAGVYKSLIAIIPDDAPVKTIVVNMNYRSFGPVWINSKLENAIQQKMVFYNDRPPLLNRFLMGLNFYDSRTPLEADRIIQQHWKTDQLPFEAPKNTVKTWCDLEKWGDWQDPNRQMADRYIQNYAFIIDEDNVRVQDFDEIVTIAQAKNLNLIFLILPENIEQMEYLVGPELVQLILDNVQFLENRYSNMGITVINKIQDAPDSTFIERNYPSEHYTEEIRIDLARSVTDKVIKMRNE